MKKFCFSWSFQLLDRWLVALDGFLAMCQCHFSAIIDLLKFNNRSNKTMCEIYSKLTIKTPERHQWRPSGIFIVNSELISHIVWCFHCWLWTSQCQSGTTEHKILKTHLHKIHPKMTTWNFQGQKFPFHLLVLFPHVKGN